MTSCLLPEDELGAKIGAWCLAQCFLPSKGVAAAPGLAKDLVGYAPGLVAGGAGNVMTDKQGSGR
jgi:hypothetical protein